MKLDAQQEKAVKTEATSALVIAGAGSGKTRVLTERIAYLTKEKKVSPYEILCWTFTRKAAQEMKERLELRMGGSQAHHVTIGTMHAVALQMLRRFGEIIGLRPNHITVYSEWEENFLLREVAAEIGILVKKTWKIPKKDIDRMFSDYYEQGKEPDESHPGLNLFKAFMVRCRENNALTYGGLLAGLELLIPTMAKYRRIRHILVDEAQDIDPLQWRIINKLKEAFGASLFVVGDIRQSIYSFRGACPEYLLFHQDDFQIFELQSNYRSVPSIVDAANRLMDHSEGHLGHWMHAVRPDGMSQVIVQGDMDSEYIASLLELDLAAVVDEPVAVLARNHALLRRLSEELTAEDIPHQYVGRKSALTNSEEFRRFHAFLKLIVNPFDNFAFLLIRELLKVTPEEFRSIRLRAVTEGKSHFHVWFEDNDGLDPAAKIFYDPLGAGLGAACFAVKYLFIGASPFSEPIVRYDPEEAFQFIFSWLARNPSGTIGEYLDWLATYDLQDELSEKTEGVTLCTIHAAKGLEWPSVIVAGCNEGLLPSKQAIGSGEIEEERRLMYVAATRARDQLILAVRPEKKESNGKMYENPVSRFIGEMQLQGCPAHTG